MVDHTLRSDRLPRMQRLLERIEHQLGPHRRRRLPAHDPACEYVDDEGDADPALPRRHIGEVRDPQRVWPIRSELPVDVIERARRLRIAHRRAHRLAADDTAQALALHQTLHGAARNSELLPPHLPPELTHTIDLEVLVPHTPDFRHQRLVRLGPCRAQLRIGPSGRVRVVRRRGDRQHLADGLDPVNVAMVVDEALHLVKGRSSSAWAKDADALRRISSARRSSRTWRSSNLMRSFGRRHALALAGITLVLPDPAAQRVGRTAHLGRHRHNRRPLRRVPPWCSRTIFTDRSRTSGEHLLALLMAPSSQVMEPPGFPGRFRML
ncbi:hypothetical protein XOO1121 [Xanthomonas oryzae pv. oryzae KACC 10331]|uniref:Uncharacterized protein n=1 Tax=Xanthomonas oryzae pv. oryzae (strain KACC10331 / KXO85) TaxID=291331 RepID=Q5H3U6_XANOR|nr:hypothetical protein XOO1121 [Xanthomonas oryzae pv. oryzae KACC 10331]